MKIYINGQEADITLDTEQNLGDVLKSFEMECERNNATTINIVVNGQELLANEFDTIILKSIEEIETLELTTITENDVLASLQDIGERFCQIVDDLKMISVQFQNGHDKQAFATVTKLADNVDYFCKATALSSLFPERFVNMDVEGVKVQDFFADFSSVLAEFEEAFKNSDSIMLGDLAEYEITPRIESIVAMINTLS